MEKVKSKTFFLFWSLLGLGALIFIWFLPWRFQVNDDVIMMWLVSGAYTGTPESYAVFIHPLLSWTFSKLYTFAPTIPWYPFTWYLVIYLSYLVFLKAIEKNFNSTSAKTVWVLFILGLLVHFLFFLQFSIVSAFAISAGFAFRLNHDSRIFNIYAADLLILFGVLIRMEVLLLFLLGLLGLQLLFRKLYMAKLLLIPMLFLALGYCFNLLWLNINGLSEFYELNKLRSLVFDHPALQMNKSAYLVSDPQLFSFSNGLMDFQTDDLTKNKLLGWKDLLDQSRFESMDFKNIWFSLYYYILNEKYLILIACVFVTFRILETWKSTMINILIFALVALLLSPFYLLKIQVYVIFFLLFLLWSLTAGDTENAKLAYSKLFASFLLVMIGVHIYNFLSNVKRDEANNKIMSLLKESNKSFNGEIILIASNEVYAHLTPGKPFSFQLLGWPTLLENSKNHVQKVNRKYLIDKEIFDTNFQYFKELQQRSEGSNQLIIF